MNICFFTENHYKGGLDTFIINLLNEWPENNDVLTLVCNSSHPGLENIEEKTLRLTTFKKYSKLITSRAFQGQGSSKYHEHYIFRLVFLLLQYPVILPWHILSLSLYFRKSNFERLMVINGGYPASIICRCAIIAWSLSGKKSKAILNFHNSVSRPSWYFIFPEYLIDLAVSWSSGHIVSVSKNCLNSLNSRKAFNNNKLSYIYNGIQDPIKTSIKNNNSNIGNFPPQAACLMLATYEERKGYDYLLKAFKIVVKKIPDATLKIYGHGNDSEKQNILSSIKNLNLQGNVMLNDFVSDVSSLFDDATMLVVPSQAYESFGLTIIEAMAYSTPIVATNVGGMPEVLDGSNAGFICSKNDPIKFANCIVSILNDKSLALKLGINGRKVFVEKFSAKNMSKKYELLIKE